MGGDGGSGVFIFRTGGAPTISSHPSSVSVEHGAAATFSVSASVSYSESLTYQWQKAESNATSTWTNISGATSSSYTTSSTAKSSDNGDLYRVVTTATTDGANASTTSNSATLTVTDTTPPVSSGSITATTTTGTSVSVDYTATDASNGVSSVTVYYSTAVNLGSPTSCGSATSLSGSSVSGTITCTIPASDATYYVFTRASDGTNTESAPSSADDSIIRDATRPSVSSVARSGSGTLKSGQTDTVTFTFSESTSNFVVGDVTVSGGALSSFAGSGSSYTATFTPTSGAAGTASISVAANAFTDAAGNGNTASSALTVAYDTQAPTVSVTRAGSGTLRSGQTDTVTFT
ncbi:MAG: hypothetical protein EB145_16455, partial [Proteobacteria bacterium]|nr:hypothetical protein [Pseudomonadota bacterium]